MANDGGTWRQVSGGDLATRAAQILEKDSLRAQPRAIPATKLHVHSSHRSSLLNSTMFARSCSNLRLRTQLALHALRTPRAAAPKPWRTLATSAPRRNAETTLHRSTELGAVEETQDIATMDRLLKICSE